MASEQLVRCPECGNLLTKEQLQQGGKFCGRSCAGKFMARNRNSPGETTGTKAGMAHMVEGNLAGQQAGSSIEDAQMQGGQGNGLGAPGTMLQIPVPVGSFQAPGQVSPFVPFLGQQPPQQHQRAPPRHPDKRIAVPFQVQLTGQAASAIEQLVQSGVAANEAEAISMGLSGLLAAYHQGQSAQGIFPQQQPQYPGYPPQAPPGWNPYYSQYPQYSQPMPGMGTDALSMQRARLEEKKLEIEEARLNRMLNEANGGGGFGVGSGRSSELHRMYTEEREMRMLEKMYSAGGVGGGAGTVDPALDALRQELSQLRLKISQTEEQGKFQHVIDTLQSQFAGALSGINNQLNALQANQGQKNDPFMQWTLAQMGKKDDQMLGLAGQATDAKMATIQLQTQALVGQIAGELNNLRNAVAAGQGMSQKEGDISQLTKSIDSLKGLQASLIGLAPGAQRSDSDAIVEGLGTVMIGIKPVFDRIGASVAHRLDIETAQEAEKRAISSGMELRAKQTAINQQLGVPVAGEPQAAPMQSFVGAPPASQPRAPSSAPYGLGAPVAGNPQTSATQPLVPGAPPSPPRRAPDLVPHGLGAP